MPLHQGHPRKAEVRLVGLFLRLICAGIVVQPAATLAESAIVPGTLSLEARAELQKEQTLDLNKYLYDLNSRKQLSRPKRTVSTYEPKQKEFIVSFRIHMSTDS